MKIRTSYKTIEKEEYLSKEIYITSYAWCLIGIKIKLIYQFKLYNIKIILYRQTSLKDLK